MDKNKKRKIIDKKSFHDFVYTTSLAFTMQAIVATIVMFISSSSTASEQSRISSIYETPGFLSKSTLLQFFVVALLTGVIRHIFMSDLILKIKSIALRIALMFTFEIIMVAIVVWKCQWFHSVRVGHWIGFVIGALPCMIAGIVMAYKSECKENEEMNEALRRKQQEDK
jgi:hypothetical protein